MASVFKQVSDALKSLPGIGHKSAERIVFHLLAQNEQKNMQLAQSIIALTQNTSHCNNCGLISEYNPCRICSSPQREKKTICVVKNVQNALIIERSGSYKGLYHVLGQFSDELDELNELDEEGKQKPLPDSIKKLLVRLETGEHSELLFALESGLRYENITRFIVEKVGKTKSKINFSKMAVGIPLGAGLEYVDDDTIKQSIEHRYVIR